MPRINLSSWIRSNMNVSFLKGVALLSAGSVVGQGFVICSYPFLARLYRPSDFGVLAVYSATISLLAVVGALRYELAIPIPKEERLGLNLLVLSLALTAATTMLVAAGVLLVGDRLVAMTHTAPARPYLWLLPVGFFAVGCYQVFVNWSLRNERFLDIARSKAAQGLGQAVTQLVLGVVRFGGPGLLLGDLTGQLASNFCIVGPTLKRTGLAFHGVSLRAIRDAAGRYRRFPIFSSWATLLNTGSLQLAPILLAILYGPQVAGWFSLSWRAVLIPTVFVGEAVSQVYSATASRLAREDPEALSRLFFRMSLTLLGLGAVPVVLIASFAPEAFRTVFGATWQESGVYVRILGAALLAQFVVGSLSRTLAILERQRWQLAWDAGRFVIVIGGLLLVAHYRLPSRLAVAVYSLSLVGTYLAFFFLSAAAVGRSAKHRGAP